MIQKDALDRAILNWNEATTDKLALDLFHHQFNNIPAYRSFSKKLNATPENVRSMDEIPFLPTSAFRLDRLADFPESNTRATFRSSGTTEEARSSHPYDSLELYDSSCLRSFDLLTPGVPTGVRLLSLIPSADETPTSSLAHMISTLGRERFGDRVTYGFHRGSLDFERVRSAFLDISRPVVIAATTSSLSDLLSECERNAERYSLPKGSWLFHTGGRKAQRALPTANYLAELVDYYLGIVPKSHRVEYGMTELSTPAWGVFRENRFIYQFPPWCPHFILSSAAEGPLAVFDFANRSSVSALQTGDWAIRHAEGFEIVGRLSDREVRGCSALTPLSRTSTSKTKSPEITFQPKARDLFETLLSLSKLTEIWRNPESPARIQFETTLSARSDHVRSGITRTFEALTDAHLQNAVRESWSENRPPRNTERSVYISAGNLPIAGVFDFYAALLRGGVSLHRPSSASGGILKALHQTFSEIDPLLAGRIAIVETNSENEAETRNLLEDADHVVIQGDDSTIEDIRSLLSKEAAIKTYGTKWSFGICPSYRGLTDADLRALFDDVLIWNQQGCLSPQFLLIEGTEKEAEEMEKRLAKIPFEREPREQAWLDWIRNEAEMMGAKRIPRRSWFGTPGFVQVIPFRSIEELLEVLNSFGTTLSSASYPLESENHSMLNLVREKQPLLRLVPFGELQSPTFEWRQDGYDRLN